VLCFFSFELLHCCSEVLLCTQHNNKNLSLHIEVLRTVYQLNDISSLQLTCTVSRLLHTAVPEWSMYFAHYSHLDHVHPVVLPISLQRCVYAIIADPGLSKAPAYSGANLAPTGTLQPIMGCCNPAKGPTLIGSKVFVDYLRITGLDRSDVRLSGQG